MVNKAILVGRLGKDPSMIYTAQGTAVTTMSVATERKWKQDGQVKKETTWLTVTAWGELGETANSYLTKGRMIYVEGYIKREQWEDEQHQKRERWTIVAEVIRYLEKPVTDRRPYMEEASLPDDLGNAERHEAAV